MASNPHTPDEILVFVDELISTLNQQKKVISDKIREYHAPKCTATEANRDKCFEAFEYLIIDITEQRMWENSLEV